MSTTIKFTPKTPGDWPNNDPHNITMLNNLYNILTKEDMWDWAAKDPLECTGYMFHRDKNITRLMKHPEMYNGHSGASFAICMRQMNYIAKYGWDAYVNEVSNNNFE